MVGSHPIYYTACPQRLPDPIQAPTIRYKPTLATESIYHEVN